MIFEDHAATTFNRPEWLELLLDVKKKRGALDLSLFTKWDRFSRNAGNAYHMITTLTKIWCGAAGHRTTVRFISARK